MQTLLEVIYPKDKAIISRHFQLSQKIRDAKKTPAKEMEILKKDKKANDDLLKKAMGENFDFLTDSTIDPDVAKNKLKKDQTLIETQFQQNSKKLAEVRE